MALRLRYSPASLRKGHMALHLRYSPASFKETSAEMSEALQVPKIVLSGCYAMQVQHRAALRPCSFSSPCSWARYALQPRLPRQVWACRCLSWQGQL